LTQFKVDLSSFDKHGAFLQEFSDVVHFNEHVEIACNTELLNNLILIATIILNDDMKKEAERSLQDYIEIFFKNMDGEEIIPSKNLDQTVLNTDEIKISDDEDDDLTSQYSTLSSMLGLQSSEKKNYSQNKLIEQKVGQEYEM